MSVRRTDVGFEGLITAFSFFHQRSKPAIKSIQSALNVKRNKYARERDIRNFIATEHLYQKDG
jgi:hypothetical protein